MASGLRVTRIDKAPATGPVNVVVNGVELGDLPHRRRLELTVNSGEVLVEVTGLTPKPLFQVLEVAPGCTACMRFGRRGVLGLLEASHYVQIDPPVFGLPDRSQYPLNLAAHSALQWLRRKRAMGEPLSPAQLGYLRSQQARPQPNPQKSGATVPSLTELGAFAALGLDADAREADVREAFRLLISIHAPESGQANETILRLEEAFRVAMHALAQRVRSGVSEVGR